MDSIERPLHSRLLLFGSADKFVTLGPNNLNVLLDFEWRTFWCNIMSVLLHIFDALGRKYVRPRTLGSEKMYILSEFLCVKDALLCVLGNTEDSLVFHYDSLLYTHY